MLRVKGESMIDAGILDGDILVVQRAQEARNGEIVVALARAEILEAALPLPFGAMDLRSLVVVRELIASGVPAKRSEDASSRAGPSTTRPHSAGSHRA